MTYTSYITKKRFKTLAISGPVNLPYGTVCGVQGDTIFHNGKPLCRVASQNAKDYFWGYDPENPEGEIERQKLAEKLYNSAPADSGDELAKPDNPWRGYGELIDFGIMTRWEWNKETQDYPADKLKYLLGCVKRGEKPVCIG